jgi:hypothetical protein
MATQNWLYPIRHDSDADFRGWGADLSAKLAAVGLVKTADTGQINWTTVTRPGVNTYAGYEIWRYPDSSIFMKWEFGTGSGAASPGVRVQVGTGSNGAGTLTGTLSAANTIFVDRLLASAGTQRQSVMCLSNGFFGFSGYLGAFDTDREGAFFAVSRTTDANGAVTSDGACVYWMAAGNTLGAVARHQALNFTTNTARTATSDGSYGYVPGSLTNSLVGADFQAFVNWAAYPAVRPTMGVVTVIRAELAAPVYTTFQTAVVGSTQRTYISLGNAIHGAVSGNTTYNLAMLFE